MRHCACLAVWLGIALSLSCLAYGDDDLLFKSAAGVNEGQLHFLARPPDKPVHHHQNRIVIEPFSLASGWVTLLQCHDHLDAVPLAQIAFREGFVRDLAIVSSHGVTEAWVEGPSVQLRQIEPGARLCLTVQTRSLRDTGGGTYALSSGPYMRKFLDGYYPMQVSLDIDYPNGLLSLTDFSPPPAPGFSMRATPGRVEVNALFEGELRIEARFTRH
ncbi:MAG: hypothetical protein LDL19_00305 [Thiobacillus sp.]|nr:hypothetical protein [Thiobacillus sp.]